MPLTSRHRDEGIQDSVLTQSEQDLDDVQFDDPNILSEYSIINLRLQLTHQPPVITDRAVRGWQQEDKGKIRKTLFQSELCNHEKRPGTSEKYFVMYHNTIQSLAD